MKRQPTKQTTITPEHEQSDAAFYLVSRLLEETFAANNEAVVIKSNTGNFLHDPQTKLELSGQSRVHFTGAELTEFGTKTEISISGVVESQKPIHCNFTLYFLMKRDMAVIPIKTTHLENKIGRSLIIHNKKNPKNLHDSIFELSFNRINNHGVEYSFGKGRGFLVFNIDESKITT